MQANKLNGARLAARHQPPVFKFLDINCGHTWRSTIEMKMRVGDLHSHATVRDVGLVVRVSDDAIRGVHCVLWMGGGS